jgi:hypothetical protein
MQKRGKGKTTDLENPPLKPNSQAIDCKQFVTVEIVGFCRFADIHTCAGAATEWEWRNAAL